MSNVKIAWMATATVIGVMAAGAVGGDATKNPGTETSAPPSPITLWYGPFNRT